MRLLSPCALLTVALAISASAQQGNTRQVVRDTNRWFFEESSSQCLATSTDSLSQGQVSGLEELPAAIRGELLKDLPLQLTGNPEHEPCLDAAAWLLAARLGSLCWPDVSVTWEEDGQAGSAASKPRFRVKLGAPYHFGQFFVVTDENPRTSPALIIQGVQSAIPEDGVCTASTLEDMWERVSRLGTFLSVRIKAGALLSEQERVRYMVIDVREKAPATP